MDPHCPHCGGTGFQISVREGREFATPCSCRRPAPASGDALLAACRIPPRYEHCTLAHFEPGNPSLSAGLEKLQRLGLVASGDTVIIVCGTTALSGATNMMKIHRF